MSRTAPPRGRRRLWAVLAALASPLPLAAPAAAAPTQAALVVRVDFTENSGACGIASLGRAFVLRCAPVEVRGPLLPPPPDERPPLPVDPVAPAEPPRAPEATLPVTAPSTPVATAPAPRPAVLPLRFYLGPGGGELLGTIDLAAGGGTVTMWRVVRSGDREYLEMTLGW